MTRRLIFGGLTAAMLLAGAWPEARAIARADASLTLQAGKVTLAGTSNVHDYSASTTSARLVSVKLGDAMTAADLPGRALEPGAIQAFEVAIPAKTLTSGKDGLDKNMWKALKVDAYPDITFTLTRLDLTGEPAGAARAIGRLNIAGVEREVALEIATQPGDGTLAVHGHFNLVMTDYGIKPPVAMLGMLKTDPKVTITFDAVLGVSAPPTTR